MSKSDDDHYELLFPSEYVKCADLRGNDVTKTISKVWRDELQMRGGVKKKKAILSFKDSEKKLVCNRTNADTIAKLYGPHTSEWIGKKITMYPTTTTFGSETKDCIRIRPSVPSGKATAEPKHDETTGEVAPEPGSDG
jgi:hypothetical protein